MSLTTTSLLNRLLSRGKFRHVQVLLALVEMGSVQRAAARIGLTQSSVTQSLAYLEDLLELPLFERHARGITPTPACLDLLPVARQLMQGLTSSAEAMAGRHRQDQGSVRLMASAAGIQGLLATALPAFAEKHPGIQVQLSEAEGPDQWQSMARGEVDLAVCRRRPILPDGWEFQALREDRMVVVCSARHPLARARRVDARRLASHRWLLMPAGTAARAHYDDLASSFPTPAPTHPVITRSLNLLRPLIEQQDLLALLPWMVVRPDLAARSLVELKVGLELPLEPIGLLFPKARQGDASRLLADFLTALAP